MAPLSPLRNRQRPGCVVPEYHPTPSTLSSENQMHRFAEPRLACTLTLAAIFGPVSLLAQDSATTTSPPLLTAPLPGPRLGRSDEGIKRRLGNKQPPRRQHTMSIQVAGR